MRMHQHRPAVLTAVHHATVHVRISARPRHHMHQVAPHPIAARRQRAVFPAVVRVHQRKAFPRL